MCGNAFFFGVPCVAFLGVPCATQRLISFHPRLDLGQDAADIILLDDNFSSARCLPQPACHSPSQLVHEVKEQLLGIVPCNRLSMVWNKDGLQVPALHGWEVAVHASVVSGSLLLISSYFPEPVPEE